LEKKYKKSGRICQELRGKLSNPTFIDKAPTEVINKEKAKLADFTINTHSTLNSSKPGFSFMNVLTNAII